MTLERIEEWCSEPSGFDAQERAFKNFLDITSSSIAVVFDDHSYRAKIIFPARSVMYLDRDGGVRTDDQVDHKIPEQDLRRVDRYLRSTSKYEDLLQGPKEYQYIKNTGRA